MKKIAFIFVFLMTTHWSAFAESGRMTLSPASRTEQSLAVNINKSFTLRVTTSLIQKAVTATINITRGGRSVGEFPLRRDNDSWVMKSKLELPGAHIITVRFFDKERIWAAATDLTVLAESDPVPQSEISEDLEFTMTSGKPGNDTNGWWGILPLMVLIAGVGFGTNMFRKHKTA